MRGKGMHNHKHHFVVPEITDMPEFQEAQITSRRPAVSPIPGLRPNPQRYIFGSACNDVRTATRSQSQTDTNQYPLKDKIRILEGEKEGLVERLEIMQEKWQLAENNAHNLNRTCEWMNESNNRLGADYVGEKTRNIKFNEQIREMEQKYEKLKLSVNERDLKILMKEKVVLEKEEELLREIGLKKSKEEELIKLDGELRNCKEKLQTYESTRMGITSQLEYLKKKVEELTSQNEKFTQQNLQHVVDATDREKQLQESKKDVQILKIANEDLTKKLTSNSEEFKSSTISSNAKISGMEKQLEGYRGKDKQKKTKEKEEWEKKAEALKSQLNIQKESFAMLNTDKASLEGENKRLFMNQAVLETDADRLRAIIKDYANENTQLKRNSRKKKTCKFLCF